MKDPNVRIVLDMPAVLAYGNNVNLGETIAEVVDGGGRFGVSVLTVIDARRYATLDLEHLAASIDLLLAHVACDVLPVEATDADPLLHLMWAGAAELSRAATLLEAIERHGYVVTPNPDRYLLGDDDDIDVADLPVIGI